MAVLLQSLRHMYDTHDTKGRMLFVLCTLSAPITASRSFGLTVKICTASLTLCITTEELRKTRKLIT